MQDAGAAAIDEIDAASPAALDDGSTYEPSDVECEQEPSSAASDVGVEAGPTSQASEIEEKLEVSTVEESSLASEVEGSMVDSPAYVQSVKQQESSSQPDSVMGTSEASLHDSDSESADNGVADAEHGISACEKGVGDNAAYLALIRAPTRCLGEESPTESEGDSDERPDQSGSDGEEEERLYPDSQVSSGWQGKAINHFRRVETEEAEMEAARKRRLRRTLDELREDLKIEVGDHSCMADYLEYCKENLGIYGEKAYSTLSSKTFFTAWIRQQKGDKKDCRFMFCESHTSNMLFAGVHSQLLDVSYCSVCCLVVSFEFGLNSPSITGGYGAFEQCSFSHGLGHYHGGGR